MSSPGVSPGEVTGSSFKARSRSRSPRPRTRSRSGSPDSRSRARTRSRTGSPRSRSRSRSYRRRSRSPRRYSRSPGRRSSRSRTPSPDLDGNRLHVADLDSNVSKRDLEECFLKFGPLIEIWMARSVPCFAFVVFKRKEDAFEACRAADGQVGSLQLTSNYFTTPTISPPPGHLWAKGAGDDGQAKDPGQRKARVRPQHEVLPVRPAGTLQP